MDKDDILRLVHSTQKESTFFGRSPVEVRNKMYEEHLIANGPICPLAPLSPTEPRRNIWLSGTDVMIVEGVIVRTCRACVHETYPVLYGRNDFGFLWKHQLKIFKKGNLQYKPG